MARERRARERKARGGRGGDGTPRGKASDATQGYLAYKKTPPHQDHHRLLGIVLLQGPRGMLFLMSEIPLYTAGDIGMQCRG